MSKSPTRRSNLASEVSNAKVNLALKNLNARVETHMGSQPRVFIELKRVIFLVIKNPSRVFRELAKASYFGWHSPRQGSPRSSGDDDDVPAWTRAPPASSADGTSEVAPATFLEFEPLLRGAIDAVDRRKFLWMRETKLVGDLTEIKREFSFLKIAESFESQMTFDVTIQVYL